VPLPNGLKVDHDGLEILLNITPSITIRMSEAEARSLAWSINAECDVARRVRHVEARGD
jgi:hypothetical protein